MILHCGRFSLISPRQLNSCFSTNFYKKKLQNAKYIFLLCNSKEESRTVNYGTGHIKSRRGLKGPRRPTQPNDLVYFEKAARLRQQPQLFPHYLRRPCSEPLAEKTFVVAC